MHLLATTLVCFVLSFASLTTAQISPLPTLSLMKRAPCNVATDCTGTPPPAKNSRFVCVDGECATECRPGFARVETENGPRCRRTGPPPCRVANCSQPIPDNATKICQKGQCAFKCDDGFRYNGTQCIPGPPPCKASACTGPIPENSHAACRNSQCDFYCNAGFHRQGDNCVADNVECTRSSQCGRASKPPNSHVFCFQNRCGVTCNNGFMTAPDGSCVANESTCGETTCDSINNGSVQCDNGQCTYTCNTTYQKFENNGRTQCINTSKDASNCGSVGNSCPPDYTGSGTASCSQGQCGLKCPERQRQQNPPFGPAFCA